MPADGGPNLPLQRAAKAEISRHGGAQERQAGSLCEHERCDACTEAIVMINHTPVAGSLAWTRCLAPSRPSRKRSTRLRSGGSGTELLVTLKQRARTTDRQGQTAVFWLGYQNWCGHLV